MGQGITHVGSQMASHSGGAVPGTMRIAKVLYRQNIQGLRLKGIGSLETALRLLSTGAGRRLGISLWASRVFGRVSFTTEKDGSVLREHRRLQTSDLFGSVWQKILSDVNRKGSAFYEGRFIKAVPRDYVILVNRLGPNRDLFHFSIHVDHCLRRRQEKRLRRFLGQEPTLDSVNIRILTKQVVDEPGGLRSFLFDLNQLVEPLQNVFPEFKETGTSLAESFLAKPVDGDPPMRFEMPVTFNRLPMTLSIYSEDVLPPQTPSAQGFWGRENQRPGIIRGPLIHNPDSHDPDSMLRPRLEICLSPHHDPHNFYQGFPFIHDHETKAALEAGKLVFQGVNRIAKQHRRLEG